MAHDVFISYAAADKPTADAVCATLEARGIRCWIAPRDVTPGVTWAAALVRAIHDSRVLVLVFSERSNVSQQVLREVERAVSAAIPVLPLRIEAVTPSDAMEYFLGAPHWLDAVTPPLERHLEYLANTVALLLEREHRADGPGQTTVPGSLRGPATEHSAFGRRRLLVTGSGALAVAASGIAALALRARPKRVSGHPQAAAAPPAQAGARTVTLPAPFAAITVIAADGAASVKLDEAVKDFGAILPQLASDYAPPQSMRWTVHLVSDLSLARQVLAGDIGFNQSAVDSFFKNGNSLQTQYFEAGVQTLFYLPNSPDTRGNLAWAAGSYLTYTQGGNKDDVYPYWFRRGVPIYLRVRFTETGYSLARAASGDVKSGTAPSLSSISVYSDVYAFQAKLSSNTMRVDVRSEAAVEYMAKQYGEAAIGRLLRDNQFGNIPKFTDLLQQVTGMGVQGLDRALNASLTQ